MESYSSVLGIDVSASHNTRNEVSPTLLPPGSKWGPKRQGGTEAGFCSGQLANPFFYYLTAKGGQQLFIYLFIYLLTAKGPEMTLVHYSMRMITSQTGT